MKKFVGAIASLLVGFSTFADTPINKYLTEIPFLPNYVKPLLILDIDRSGSMWFPAYYSPYSVVSPSYNPSKTYYGYFDSKAYYSYDRNLGAWYKDDSCSSGGIGDIENAKCVSGNFLNWLLTSREDVLMKALIGGRVSCPSSDYCLITGLHGEGSIFYDIWRNPYMKQIVYWDKWKFDIYVWLNQPDKTYVDVYKKEKVCWDPFCFIITYAYIKKYQFLYKIKIPYTPPVKRKGLIQKIYDKLNLTVFTFSSEGNPAGEGKIIYGYSADNKETLDTLVNKIQEIYPDGNTYTGESLYEVEDYLEQENNHNYESNSNYIKRGSDVDPYYILDQNGKLIPVGCRKAYVLLISDGEWNGKVDPKEPAYQLHTYDLRDDLKNNQTATVYTLYVFSDSEEGRNAMSTIAFCGGYTPDQADRAKKVCNNSRSSLSIDSTKYAKTFYTAKNGEEVEKALTQIVQKILESSGTAVAIPTTKQAYNNAGSGIYFSSYLTQATFQQFYEGERTVNWVGHAYNWWYWGNNKLTTIREDNIDPYFLNVYGKDSDGNIGDNIISWNFSNETQTLEIKVCEPNPDGTPSENCEIYTSYRYVTPIVDLGKTLEETSASQRTIYVGDGDNLQTLTPDILLPYVNNNETLANNLYKWVYGIDVNGLRIRTPNGDIDSEGYGSWKLGDIVYGAPLLVDYGNYTVAYIASNDGMLHAFYMGYAKRTYNAQKPIHLQNSPTDTNTDRIGQELWAFIPKNALPYLKYFADPNYGLYPNKHLYINDLSPYLVRYKGHLILIGGMRLGGAVGSKDTDAVNPPEVCKNIGNKCGLSEYYALDITDPNNPKLLWEFSAPGLGFTTSGPGIFKFTDNAYVVFGSGPINYKATYQETDSDTLKFYVVNLLTGDLVDTIDTGIKRAFAGRIFQEAKQIGDREYLPVGYSTGYADKVVVNVDTTNDENNPVQTAIDNLTINFVAYQPVIDADGFFKDISGCKNYDDLKDDLNNNGCGWIINSGELPYKYLENCLDNWKRKTRKGKCILRKRGGGEKLTQYAKEKFTINDAYSLIFKITKNGDVNGNYLLTLYNSQGIKPPQVGANPYIYNSSKPDTDEEYWTTLYKTDFPVTVVVEKEGGDFKGGIIILSAKEEEGELNISWQNVRTLTDTDGNTIQLKPVTSKVVLGTCGNRSYLFGGTGRWFYKEDNLETDEPFRQNFIFGVPINCSNGKCQLENVEDVTDKEQGTQNIQVGWYIKLNNANATAELLREKDISDPNLNEKTGTIIYATVQPSCSYCSISQGQTRFWVMNCTNGGAIQNSNVLKGSIVTQLSTSQVINLPLSQFKGKRVTEKPFAGIAAPSAPQLISPTPLPTKGQIILWLEY